MLTIFVGKIKQQMFYWLWELKPITLINNHVIIKYFDYIVWSPYAVAVYSSVIFHNVTVFQCYFSYFKRSYKVNHVSIIRLIKEFNFF